MATAICRHLTRKGLRVAPFKAQNLSNNSAVCADGGEIGRSQAAQAEACGIDPTVDMNPILLKPQGDGCQAVVNGRVWKTLGNGDLGKYLADLRTETEAAFHRLAQEYDFVVMEGAGSAAELNLRGPGSGESPARGSRGRARSAGGGHRTRRRFRLGHRHPRPPRARGARPRSRNRGQSFPRRPELLRGRPAPIGRSQPQTLRRRLLLGRRHSPGRGRCCRAGPPARSRIPSSGPSHRDCALAAHLQLHRLPPPAERRLHHRSDRLHSRSLDLARNQKHP